ncbi:13E12 repeat family protein [Mycobacterium avium subsp. paratuberculosis K-10]|uniref:13E12 repeat family protein n=1 Tax=Mycobacterium avium TaxID=1764 RepID=UPI0021E0B096|nr:13E12 repeat family protein [Mycobacterium avium]UYB88522.1 13E12 repeat family protein [Mycobacterium avium subsp. paratuberculosis K-10]
MDGYARSAAQRNHDGLAGRSARPAGSGHLGQHNGLPASILVTTTLADLETAAGRRLTGRRHPATHVHVIRLSRHAHHYLAISTGQSLALPVSHQTPASPAQRIVLYAKEPRLHRTRLHRPAARPAAPSPLTTAKCITAPTTPPATPPTSTI